MKFCLNEMIDRYQKDGAKQVILDDKQRKNIKNYGSKNYRRKSKLK